MSCFQKKIKNIQVTKDLKLPPPPKPHSNVQHQRKPFISDITTFRPFLLCYTKIQMEKLAEPKREVFEVFDEDNKLVGTEYREIVHKKGLLHRAVNVFVLNSKGDILLQKRSPYKTVCPSSWDLSVTPSTPHSENNISIRLQNT